MSDALLFVRRYLDRFDAENWDGHGIKSMTVVSARWCKAVVQSQMTDVAIAKVHYAEGDLLTLECWADDAPNVQSGHIFREADDHG